MGKQLLWSGVCQDVGKLSLPSLQTAQKAPLAFIYSLYAVGICCLFKWCTTLKVWGTNCQLGTGSVLFVFQPKASSVFLSLFSSLNTNEVTKGTRQNSLFHRSAKPVFKPPLHVISAAPALSLFVLVKHSQKLPSIPGKYLGNDRVICCCSRLSVSALGPSSLCFS